MKKFENDVYTALLGVILGVLVTLLAVNIVNKSKKFDGDYNRWRKLNLILQEVQRNYVDTIDMSAMTDAAVAAALAELFELSIDKIEYAAEMGLEHHLGLTCDPVCGLVQIPCIERNAYAAARALDASIYALYTDGRHRVSFDQVVKVMMETGNDLPSVYKETSEGGLAKHLDK